MPELVTTSSPMPIDACNSACSRIRLRCGRIIRKYIATEMMRKNNKPKELPPEPESCARIEDTYICGGQAYRPVIANDSTPDGQDVGAQRAQGTSLDRLAHAAHEVDRPGHVVDADQA